MYRSSAPSLTHLGAPTASYLDVYNVLPSPPYLSHAQRLSVIPPHQHPTRAQYRGDTLRLSADRRRLFVTTRGKTPRERGWVAVFDLAGDGAVREREEEGGEEGYGARSRFETRNSGGKANAIEAFPLRRRTRPGGGTTGSS